MYDLEKKPPSTVLGSDTVISNSLIEESDVFVAVLQLIYSSSTNFMSLSTLQLSSQI